MVECSIHFDSWAMASDYWVGKYKIGWVGKYKIGGFLTRRFEEEIS